jgi:pyruvate,water dikinase
VDPAAFRAIFERFKEVLDSNNRALETITDIGEKLSGDYLIDINYVKKAYSHLRNDLEFPSGISTRSHRTVMCTSTMYSGRIDSLIQQMVSGAPPAHANLVLFCEDILGHGAGGGRKNAHLSEVKNRLNLCPGLLCSDDRGFDEIHTLQQARRSGSANRAGPLSPDTALQELQELIIHGPIPPSIGQALHKSIQKIRNRNGDCFLAVRSSAEEEDSGRSFAGQFKTILNVPLETEHVGRAYRKVIASLFSEKAIAYQRQMSYEPGRLKMAVGCMVMVDAVSSGIMYSIALVARGHPHYQCRMGTGRGRCRGEDRSGPLYGQEESAA